MQQEREAGGGQWGNANIRKHYKFGYGHHQLGLIPARLLSKCTL